MSCTYRRDRQLLVHDDVLRVRAGRNMHSIVWSGSFRWLLNGFELPLSTYSKVCALARTAVAANKIRATSANSNGLETNFQCRMSRPIEQITGLVVLHYNRARGYKKADDASKMSNGEDCWIGKLVEQARS